jgi:hypothetical protein
MNVSNTDTGFSLLLLRVRYVIIWVINTPLGDLSRVVLRLNLGRTTDWLSWGISLFSSFCARKLSCISHLTVNCSPLHRRRPTLRRQMIWTLIWAYSIPCNELRMNSHVLNCMGLSCPWNIVQRGHLFGMNCSAYCYEWVRFMTTELYTPAAGISIDQRWL